jgi:FAD/FMN-containing dehydrogenase
MVNGWHRTNFVTLTTPLEEDGDLVCQAGARWDEINRILEEKGIPLFFPVCDNS